MENKNKGDENKIILKDFNCTMDKMVRDGENRTKRLYWCCSSYALSKLIVDKSLRIYGEGRTQIPKYSKEILKSAKKIWKTLHQANFHSWISEFLSKIPNIIKISNEHFSLCEAEISLDEVIKSRWNHKILKQIINPRLMMALQQNFKNTFQMN